MITDRFLATPNVDRNWNRCRQVEEWAKRQEIFEVEDVVAAHGVTSKNAHQILRRLVLRGLVWRIRLGTYQHKESNR